MPKPNELYLRSDRAAVEGYYDKHSELHALRMAELASDALRDAMLEAQRRFARRHGVTRDDARILLMDTGVRLPKRSFMLAARSAA